MANRRGDSAALAYLCVDDFLRTLIDAQALKTAFHTGLIASLEEGSPRSSAYLETHYGGNRTSLRFLLDLLAANGVVQKDGGNFQLTPAFRTALQYRDLLQAKLQFAGLAAADFLELSHQLALQPEEFARRARTYGLFAYNRARDTGTEALKETGRWVQLTTTLTRYEAAVLMEQHDFGAYRNVLDIGGNSGELARQLCRSHQELRVAVLDLPAVCEAGRQHLAAAPEASRILFLPGDAFADPLPGDHDLILFKSMLHDWPEAEAQRLLSRACDALPSGGRLLVFERSAMDIGPTTPPYSSLPMLLFLHSFRSPSFYETALVDLGLVDVSVLELELDTPFLLITATKPA
jgi:hypothetical protein